MPISAVDCLAPAFEHMKKQLTQPFRMGQWVRLAFVGFLAGELGSGGGCNARGNFQMPSGQGGSPLSWPSINPAVLAAVIAVGVAVGIVFWVLFMYLNGRMRFVLFDSILAKECRIAEYWKRRRRPGIRYFVWQLLFGLSFLAALTIVIGIPAAIGLAAGWFNHPRQHILALVLGGIVVFLIFFALFIAVAIITVMTKDFVVPQMALENVTPMEGWRRLWPKVKASMGEYAGYIGMKIVMAIGASLIVGIATFVVILFIVIPVGALGVFAVIAGKAAGLTWNAYTITLVVVAAFLAFSILMFLTALLSVPVIVFFPAYSIYFFAARYPALADVLYPLPPAPPAPPPPPEAPPLMPEPSPIG